MKKALNRLLSFYSSLNKNIRKRVLVYSLAEECDNQAMWGCYADESKGFCIEYKFPEENYLARRMLLNLLPNVYGDKPLIRFFDMLVRSLDIVNRTNPITIDDRRSWLISAATKPVSYQFQNEWRVALDARIAFDPQKEEYQHLLKFPFATSIIMGERISKRNAKKLAEIAKKKGLSLFQRRLNLTGSSIVLEQIL